MSAATALSERKGGPHLRMKLAELARHLLHRNGNDLYRVPLGDGSVVVKVYSGSRTLRASVAKTLGNWLTADQTSVMPRHRRRKELECLALWRKSGFLVFDLVDGLIVDDLPPDLYAVFRYVEAPRFVEYFADRSIPLAERLATWRRFLPVWHRRHRLAIDTRDPRLIHENGDLKHVMMIGDEFLFFDFETVFRSRRRLPEVTAREILCYLKSMGRTVGREEFDAFLAETIAHYPGRDLLASTWDFAFRDRNPLRRIGRAIERRLRPRARKPYSKYSIAQRIRERLDGQPGDA